ncbi:hypothetical protein ACFXTH_005894 [Malus domestica]
MVVKDLTHQRGRFSESDWTSSLGQSSRRSVEALTSCMTRYSVLLVSKVGGGRPFDLLQHCPLGNNPVPIVPVEPIPAPLKPINLEKGGGSNSRSDGTDQRVEQHLLI